jgi:hypothetical protein
MGVKLLLCHIEGVGGQGVEENVWTTHHPDNGGSKHL